MNELQIKITADVKDIQSALTRVKKTLKDFEDSMSTTSDKSNGNLERQKGIIEQLNAKINSYKTSITRALSEQEIAKYNAKLQETQKDLARLNALGKVFEQTSVKVQEQTGLIGQLSAKLKELKSSLQQATTEKEVERLNIELAQTSKELTRISSLGKVFEKNTAQVQEQTGLIGKLNSQLKQLKLSLQQATSEEEVARLNSELAQTSSELSRINSLGKTITAPAVKSFDKFRVSAGAASGSAIAFNRIIQDAPFGIIGVGNNIQQFAEQLGALRTTTGSTGAALSTFFRSLFTGSNLVILGVSAITAALTAYQLGAFDSAEETKDLAKELEDYKNTLDGVTKAQLEGVQSSQSEIQSFKLLQLQAENANLPLEKRIRAVKELKNQFPDYLKGLSDEEILLGNVGTAYNNVTTSIIAQAKAKAFSEQITENLKKEVALLVQEEQRAVEILEKRAELEKATRIQTSRLKNANQFTVTDITVTRIQSELNDLLQENLNSEEQRKKLGQEILSIESKIPEQIEKAGGLIDANKDKVSKAVKEVQFYDEVWNENEKRLLRIIELTNKIADELPEPQIIPKDFKPTEEVADVVPLGKIEELEKQIALFESLKRATQDTDQITLYSLAIANLRNQLAALNGEEVKSNLQLIADAFGSMGQQIANSLNISNRSLRGFVTTLVSATPKIVAAILAKSQATTQGANAENIANAKLAAGNSVVVATEGAKALGPVGLALLPVFIAGALALVSSAFGKAGGGGGSPSAGQGSTFTNRREFGGPVSKGRAYIVGEKRPELFVPNTNGIIVPQVPSMDYSGASMAAGAMAVDVNIRGVSYGDDILFTVQQAQIRRGIR